jgi:hypothetical protein
MGDAEERVYHRLASPTQTEQETLQQLASGEIWGRPSVWSNLPKVKAYSGPLPHDRAGIEFRTSVPPDPGGAPGRPEWSGPRPGVAVEGGVAKLVCVIMKVVATLPETPK